MSLNSRIDSIEKRIAKIGMGGNCATCGRVNGAGLRYLCGPDEPGECPACGLQVNAEGRAVGAVYTDGSVGGVKRYPWDTDPLGFGDRGGVPA